MGMGGGREVGAEVVGVGVQNGACGNDLCAELRSCVKKVEVDVLGSRP